MFRRNLYGIKIDKFTKKYLILGLVLFGILIIMGNILPDIVISSILADLALVILILYILLYVVIKIYENKEKLKAGQITKNYLINKYLMLGLIIIFIGAICLYHGTGPRGATNDCYNEFKFVSCEKQTTVYGNTVYTCLRDGKKSIVNCDAEECRAVCER